MAAATRFARFAGGQYLELGAQLNQAFPALTISAWVRNPAGHLIERSWWNDEDGFALVFGASTQFGHWFGKPAYSLHNLPVTSSVLVSDNLRHHVVGTMAPTAEGNTEWKIYADGTESATILDTRVITASSSVTTVGRRWNEARFYSGDVSNLAVWNRALSAAEVLALYQATLVILGY